MAAGVRPAPGRARWCLALVLAVLLPVGAAWRAPRAHADGAVCPWADVTVLNLPIGAALCLAQAEAASAEERVNACLRGDPPCSFLSEISQGGGG